MPANDIDAFLPRLGELFHKRLAPYTAGEKAEIARIGAAVGVTVRNCPCPDRWSDAVAECINVIRWQMKHGTLNNHINMATQSNKSTTGTHLYSLRLGVTIEWNHKIYTHLNITDDVARAYLAKFPNGAVRFAAIPTETPANGAENAENGKKTAGGAKKSGAKSGTKTAGKSGGNAKKTAEKPAEDTGNGAENGEKTE